jgi:hypothetical protein
VAILRRATNTSKYVLVEMGHVALASDEHCWLPDCVVHKNFSAAGVVLRGTVKSFGHFNHDEMLGVYCLIVLAFSPCGDSFSVDALAVEKSNKGELAYGYPIFLMRLLVAWTYFSSALIKLRVAGFSYFNKDNLPTLAIMHSLDNLHDTHFRFAFSLPAIRDYLPIIVGLVLLWELLFPLAVFVKRLRWWLLGIGILFM